MQRNDIDQEPENNGAHSSADTENADAETTVPGIEHHPEPDAENIMPAEDQPGTF